MTTARKVREANPSSFMAYTKDKSHDATVDLIWHFAKQAKKHDDEIERKRQRRQALDAAERQRDNAIEARISGHSLSALAALKEKLRNK